MPLTKAQARVFGAKLAKLIEKHGGWVENGYLVHFPTVWDKEQFEKESSK